MLFLNMVCLIVANTKRKCMQLIMYGLFGCHVVMASFWPHVFKVLCINTIMNVAPFYNTCGVFIGTKFNAAKLNRHATILGFCSF
jgi:hypothetical protein